MPEFQSTPPMQGATRKYRRTLVDKHRFNPRPLCRERLIPCLQFFAVDRFQSTPPMQGATIKAACEAAKIGVSIHAPYAGSDHYT